MLNYFSITIRRLYSIRELGGLNLDAALDSRLKSDIHI